MSKELEKKFGIVVREARTKQGWSQEHLAEIANLNRSYLGEIERGLVVPSLATVEKIAEALSIAPSVLISRCEKNAQTQRKEIVSTLGDQVSE